MNDEQRQELIRRLRQGEELSPEWARILFPPEKREYELVYHGKEREEDIIANTLAVPLQKVRTFGSNGDDWHNMLIFGDNLQVMKSLLEMKKSGHLCSADGTAGVRLVYIDPPFATKREFTGKQEERAYQDKIAGARFIEFLRRRLVLIRELLSDDGSLYLHLAEKGELRVRADHFLNVENVTDSFLGDTDRILRHIWPIQGNEKLFDNLPGKRYFEVTGDMARNGQITCIRSIVIFDEPSVAQTPRVMKLLDFFKTNTVVECRVMQHADYETLCTDNSIAPHCDFGIYGNRLLFLTQQYEPVIAGTFTKDTDLIARYIRLFDSMWNSLSVTKQNPSQATTAVSVEELFTFDETPLG